MSGEGRVGNLGCQVKCRSVPADGPDLESGQLYRDLRLPGDQHPGVDGAIGFVRRMGVAGRQEGMTCGRGQQDEQ